MWKQKISDCVVMLQNWSWYLFNKLYEGRCRDQEASAASFFPVCVCGCGCLWHNGTSFCIGLPEMLRTLTSPPPLQALPTDVLLHLLVGFILKSCSAYQEEPSHPLCPTSTQSPSDPLLLQMFCIALFIYLNWVSSNLCRKIHLTAAQKEHIWDGGQLGYVL